MIRPLFLVALSATSTCWLAACKVYDPLFCDEDTPCSDPARPFCDLKGEYAASDGVARTCIPSPFDADGGAPDAAISSDASARRVIDLAIGPDRSCAIFEDGGLRCWGSNENGKLGYPADVDRVGDDENPFEVGDVSTAGPVAQVALSELHSCILHRAGNVRCFGDNSEGLLGLGNTSPVGLPAAAPDVPLGEPAKQIVAGLDHMCALLQSGAVRCWGRAFPALGLGDGTRPIGDDETPADLPAIEIGGAVASLADGGFHVCALLAGGDGRIRCWGGAAGGKLGYGNLEPIGDDEAPATAGDVPIGGPVVSIQAYRSATCAALVGGTARCWGYGGAVLGYSDLQDFGDDEPASAAPALDIGGTPLELSGGPFCARMSDRSVRCWGRNDVGQLGHGDTADIGGDGDIVSAGPVQLGGPVAAIARGATDKHACALLDDGLVRCWGLNDRGQLGLGHLENIGDNEVPTDVPAVRVLE